MGGGRWRALRPNLLVGFEPSHRPPSLGLVAVRGSAEVVFAMPTGEAFALDVSPRKLSWDRAGTTSQVELARFLAHAQQRAAPELDRLIGPLALRLDVGLPRIVDPLHEHDLDNFLYPLVKALGAARFVSVWGTKAPGEQSSLRIEQARSAAPPRGWQHWEAHTTASTSHETEWKRQVKAALAGAFELPAGPVGLQVVFTVGPTRSWLNLWKMAIDALDPLLGRAYPDDEFDPTDGRVVRLGLHVRVDPAAHHESRVTVWATSASPEWPEAAWFTAMSERDRYSWVAEHEQRSAPSRRTRRGTPVTTRPGGSTEGATQETRLGLPSTPAGRTPSVLRELTSLEDFRKALGVGAAIVITDTASGARFHSAPAVCRGVREEYFVQKVLVGGMRNGRYYTGADEATAQERWPSLRRCKSC